MKQLGGVDLNEFLKGVSNLPGSFSERLAGPKEDAPSGSSGE